MLQVYSAISFVRIIEHGGRTNPWVVIVDKNGEPKPYVVKLFSPELIQNKDSVTNEVLGNLLAKEFGLPVPEAALIDFTPQFIGNLKRFDLLDILEGKDDRLKFATELIDGTMPFNPEYFDPFEARDLIQIDNVFAFDALIRNPDRNKIKTNMLTRSDITYLIDHELGFEIKGNYLEELNRWELDEKYYYYHVFFSHLKRSINRFKLEYFNEFEEYLKLLNINKLDSYLTQLVNCGFSSKKHQLIKDYLGQMKNNSTKFVNILKAKIS